MMVGVSADTGRCRAVFLDNAYLTDLRTGLAGAVCVRAVAPPGPLRIGIVGTGAQARYQAAAAALARPIASATVWGRNHDAVARLRVDLEEGLGHEVAIAPDLETLARNCNLIVTATTSR